MDDTPTTDCYISYYSSQGSQTESSIQNIYIYINVWKSCQRMNLRDVGSETSVNDTVQTNTNDK
jgi:Ca2+-dependent lipid-binding protein